MKQKKYLHYVGIGVIALGLFASSLLAADFKKLLAEGDTLFAKIAVEPGRTPEALSKYLAALALKPDDYEALLKTSCTLYYLGLETPSQSEQARIYKEAMEYARQAVAIDPKSVQGHFWLGVAMAKYGEAKGVMQSLFLTKEITQQMEETIRLDETYANASAYTILGRLNFLVPGILGGSKSKARQLLEKGRQLAPENTTTLLYLAQLYRDQDLLDDAIRTLKDIIFMKPKKTVYREFYLDRATARRLLPEYLRTR